MENIKVSTLKVLRLAWVSLIFNALGSCSANYDDFNQIFTSTLNQHAVKRESGLEAIINHI